MTYYFSRDATFLTQKEEEMAPLASIAPMEPTNSHSCKPTAVAIGCSRCSTTEPLASSALYCKPTVWSYGRLNVPGAIPVYISSLGRSFHQAHLARKLHKQLWI